MAREFSIILRGFLIRNPLRNKNKFRLFSNYPKCCPNFCTNCIKIIFKHSDYNESENIFFNHNTPIFQCAQSKGLKKIKPCRIFIVLKINYNFYTCTLLSQSQFLAIILINCFKRVTKILAEKNPDQLYICF